jgi:hypothetical protein
VLLLELSGCSIFNRPPPPPFLPPTVNLQTTHFFGTPLSGPTTRPVVPCPPDQALAIRVQFVALEKSPGVGEPLSATARLIAAERLGTPVLPSARLTREARVVHLSDADQFTPAVVAPSKARSAVFLDQDAALPPGVSVRFTATSPAPLDPTVAGAPASQGLELYIGRPVAPETMPATGPATAAASDPIEIAVVAQDLAPLPTESDSAEEKHKNVTPLLAVQREVALIDRQVDVREDFAIILPFRFAKSDAPAVAIVIDVFHDPGSSRHLAALSRAVEDGRHSAELAGRLPIGVATGRGESSFVTAAIGALSTPQKIRGSLVYLSGQTNALLCQDVALVADDQTLTLLAKKIREDAARPGSPTTQPDVASDLAAFGWRLDRVTFDMLGKLVADNKLPTELAAVLSDHTGEAGRHASSFEEIGRNLTSRRDFDSRLVAENLIYLEDSSPSSRVRAFDWLAARNLGPAGYEPLGPLRARRAALDRALAAPTAAVAPTGAKP